MDASFKVLDLVLGPFSDRPLRLSVWYGVQQTCQLLVSKDVGERRGGLHAVGLHMYVCMCMCICLTGPGQ